MSLKHFYVILLFFIFLGSFLISCKNRTNSPDDVENYQKYIVDEGSQNNKIIIYQIFTRLFGNKNTSNNIDGTLEENGSGKFNDITEIALKEIKSLGITHVWYTGVIEHATTTDYSTFGIINDNPEVVKGKAGSPYAIKDYYDVNPDLAENVRQRMSEFESLVKRTHEQGLKVIIDFVPNHVARQYSSDAKPEGVKDLGETDDINQSFTVNNNFYYLPNESFLVPMQEGRKSFKQTYKEVPAKASGNDVYKAQPSVNDWFETAKLNYGIDPKSGEKYFDPIPDTWLKMKDILLFWTVKEVDGFRCDMAEMVPVEFWQWVIPQVKENNPEILFVAEIYNPKQYENYLLTGKFDYLYDKVQLYDTLKHVIQGKGNTDHISTVIHDLKGLNKYMLRFLENHDEQRIASPYFAGDPYKAIPAMVISATAYIGPVMVYFGQEVGEPGAGTSGFSGDDGRSTIFDYWGVPEHQKWMNNGLFDGGQLNESQKELRSVYSDILNISKNNEAIYQGKFYDLHSINRELNKDYPKKIYSYLRYTDGQKLLFITNFSNRPLKANIVIPQEIIDASKAVVVSGGSDMVKLDKRRDYLSIETNLEPWGYRIVDLD